MRARILLLLLAAMALRGTPGAGSFAQTAAGSTVPEPIAAPPDLAVVATLHAQGAQVYECRAAADGRLAWHFREPIATLLEGGRTVGRHYAGPSWELADGSAVVGRVTGRAPGAGADDIPWLRLEVAERRGYVRPEVHTGFEMEIRAGRHPVVETMRRRVPAPAGGATQAMV